MKFIILLNILFPMNAYSSVCQRNTQVVSALEKFYRKKCDRITLEEISTLKEIDLIKKNIIELKSSDFEGFNSIEWIRLAKNELSSVPENLFLGTPNLRFLGLSDNKILFLPKKTFEKNTKIEKINLDHNLITSLDTDQFSTNHLLKVLSLSKNKIALFPEKIFKDAPLLNYLNLFENSIPEAKINELKNKFPKIQMN